MRKFRLINRFTSESVRVNFPLAVGLLAAGALWLFSVATAVALSALFDGFVILETEHAGNRYYDLDTQTANPDFHGLVIHLLEGESLRLGAQMETDSGGGVPEGADRVELFYEVGSGTGFRPLNLPFDSNQDGGIVDRWEEAGSGMVEIASGLAPGDYILSVYGRATDTNAPGNQVFLNRDGIPSQNFEALIRVSGTADFIRVMTFNVRYASAGDGSNAWSNANQSPERREVAIRAITNRRPHLIGFQEPQTNQLADLEAMLPECYALEYQGISGGQREYAAFAYDTNLLTLLDRGVFSLGNSPGGSYWHNTPGTPFDPYDFFDGLALNFPRVALWGRFLWKPTGQEFMFYTTHFDFSNAPQRASATLITDDALARTDRMPMSPLAIVVGDFNSTQTDDDWKIFTGSMTNNGVSGDFTDAWWQVFGDWTGSGTFHDFAGGIQPANERIDWVLHRGGFTAEYVEIVNLFSVSTNLTTGKTHLLYASDHYPVMATLRFPPLRPDFDRDGLPDTLELASGLSRAADADSDDDGLLDGEEDLNGNGLVDGGESDPSNGTDHQRPTDIRNYPMDGVLDYPADLLASNGLSLFWRFDGRYLYVAVEDAGEGSDHFIFIATNPIAAVPAPWAKAGQVGQYAAFLADENDSDFSGWFDAAGGALSEPIARSATYFENGGRLEGVIDLAALFGSGFTNAFYLAAAPWETADGGALVSAAQVPPGNGDSDLLGSNEYIQIIPGDLDGDGVNDLADADADGDGLADGWERAYGLNSASAAGADGAGGDPDNDGMNNAAEQAAGTSPIDAGDVLRILSAERTNQQVLLTWPALYEAEYTIECAAGAGYHDGLLWSPIGVSTGSVFPVATNQASVGTTTSGFVRVRRNP